MTEQKLDVKQIKLLLHTGTVERKVLQEKLKKAYYEGEPLITDAEYDELFGSDDYVGYTPEQNGPWEVLEHKIPMGSLDKLKTWEEAQNWFKDKGDIIWQPKLDGLSMELIYEEGKLVHAILRGGGDKGEDILKNAKNFHYVPTQIPYDAMTTCVRGEVVISQPEFDLLVKVSNESYSNRRNCVPGICRRYDGKYSNFLSFWAYDIIAFVDRRIAYPTEADKLLTLHKYGFKIPFSVFDMTEENYKHYGDIRDTAEEFQMDGLVLKTNDMQHQIALKFEPKGEQTKVTGYQWEVGVTGKLAPRILFETVNIGGSNLSQASGGSLRVLEELNAPIGSIVEVRKMNDVIPKVTRVVERPQGTSFEPLTECPICGEKLERQGTDLYCVNPKCLVKTKNKCCAVYWAIAIKGITSGYIEKLVESSTIQQPADVLKITPEQIVQTGGYSLDRAKWVVEETHKKWKDIIENQKVENFLWTLPIPTISDAAYKKLADYFKTINELEDFILSYPDNVQGYKKELTDFLGNAKGTKTFDYLRDNRKEILNLIKSMRELV